MLAKDGEMATWICPAGCALSVVFPTLLVAPHPSATASIAHSTSIARCWRVEEKFRSEREKLGDPSGMHTGMTSIWRFMETASPWSAGLNRTVMKTGVWNVDNDRTCPTGSTCPSERTETEGWSGTGTRSADGPQIFQRPEEECEARCAISYFVFRFEDGTTGEFTEESS